MDYGRCTTNTKDSIIVVKENRSSFCLKNNNKVRVEKVEVDGCLINEGQEKCDWLFALPGMKKVLFVELKGSDITKAGRQIEATIQATSRKYIKFKLDCYIATTRVPRYDSQVQKLKIYFNKKYNAGFYVKNGRFEVSI